MSYLPPRGSLSPQTHAALPDLGSAGQIAPQAARRGGALRPQGKREVLEQYFCSTAGEAGVQSHFRTAEGTRVAPLVLSAPLTLSTPPAMSLRAQQL